ncbi:ASPIC and UnbV [Planctomycetes bacterium CA13]|uniref:ASPIC and UnbV n=1 Tax=Novipirellula herctigrandis TaxID=2527986 RepID=A0A5C5ZCV3_9BACT|nr:ASPIC and UnbV [Planctomycetes bacterium CA13]
MEGSLEYMRVGLRQLASVQLTSIAWFRLGRRLMFRLSYELLRFQTLMLIVAMSLCGCGEQPRGNQSLEPTRSKDPREVSQVEPVVDKPAESSSRSGRDGSLREERVDKALAYQAKGAFREAAGLFREQLLENPKDFEVLFHLANTEAAQQNKGLAIDLLSEIPLDHPEAGLPALGVSAGWCVEIERYGDAELRYRKILEIDPSIHFARRALAHMLNRQGRRHEAGVLIRQLCMAGDVMQDELHSLIVESDAMYDPPGQPPAEGTRAYWPIGDMGQARFLFTEKKYLEAAELVQPIVESGDAPASVVAFFGRVAVEAQDDEKFSLWLPHVNDAIREYPEYWAAIGTHLIREAQYPEAVRALAEALRLDPTDLRSMRRLFQGLRSMEQPDKAEVWIAHYALMNRILRASVTIASSPSPSDKTFQTMASDLESVGRNLEATLWRSIAATRISNDKALADLRQQMKQTLALNRAFPTRDQRWCGMDLGSAPLPSLPSQIQSFANNGTKEPSRIEGLKSVDPASFRDISKEMGLHHNFRIAKDPIEKAFAIYQTFGGGIAVTDFDLDGQQDIYLAQGAADPDEFVAEESDMLYRTIAKAGSQRFVDVTEFANLKERAYTVGVTSGDWNQDGFPDLAVTNIGVNRLLVNQGDGTFVSQALDDQPDFTRLSTSLAMGDVTGDHLPDLFVCNYLRDPKIAKHPELDSMGDPLDAIAPLSVKPFRDQLYVNAGDGRVQSGFVGADESVACTGLGVIMTNLLEDQTGNQVFVANDVRNNQLWTRGDEGTFVDLAVPYGCAYGSLGSATAAMGVTAADFDRTGTIDLHVTNFINEPVSFFINGNGLFRDLHYRFNLTNGSTPMLGFGTQAIDYSNNGWPDLVVTNGHIEDLESKGQAFRQPIQLFANLGTRFELVDVAKSAYWSKPHLGRALARLDIDRDGKLDFILSDFLDPTVLMLNESPSVNHWVAFRLIGTSSERDAIGAKIKLESNDQVWTAWVTAGDGFLCKNESSVHFGLGTDTSIQRAVVTWPSGKEQTYETISVDESILLIEGEPESFVLPSAMF